MGDLLNLVDLNHGRMARKLAIHNRLVGGAEAPRNSLELPVERLQNYYAVGDNAMHTYQVAQDWSEKKSFPAEAPMKKLISEEITKRNNIKRNAPSVVARLMGVDMLPLDAKPVAKQGEKKKENLVNNFPKEKHAKNGSVAHLPLISKSARQISYDPFHHDKNRVSDEWNGSMKLNKPRSREHPQEEELQKFKKEFEAFQAARLKECAKVVEHGTIPSQWMAQENLNKEKLALYSNSGRMRTNENKPRELGDHMVKGISLESDGLQNHLHVTDLFPSDEKISASSRSRRQSRDFDWPTVAVPDLKSAITSAPTKIVILRPGLDSVGSYEGTWERSSGNTEERDNMENFLEEVKERLKHELQGKTSKRGTMVRGGGIETPYSEKPSDPKLIAQRIAKQVRESVTRDLGVNLLRSESTRSYRSEIQYNGAGSPEFISRDTRKFLSERLRNVLKGEIHPDIPLIDHKSSRSSMLNIERDRVDKSKDVLNLGNKMSYWDSLKNEDMQSRSFRCGPDDGIMPHKDLSPRNLIRSLSAPVSGASFGKLLLEDRHILTGAHIRRKHEVIENVSVKVKKHKKEKFNFKEKVSSFKYSFTLGGKLFSKKIQTAEELHTNERDFMKDIMSGPTVVMNFGERHENSTEVPPSPASVCSSGYEEFWRSAEYHSSTSSDLYPLEDNALPQAFREISSNLNELRKKLNQLDTVGSEETIIEEQPLEAEMVELEDQAEAYVRDLLVASGLYDSSSDKSLSRWDPFAKPITNRIFEEVEEAYRKKTKDIEESVNHAEKKIDHKVLLDLLNEALSTLLGPPLTMSKFRKKAIGTMPQRPHGRKLLNHVWEIIRVYVYPQTDKSYYSLDDLVTRDLQSVPWSVLMNDDIDSLGKEMECQITGDMIEEIVKDILSS